MAENRLTPEIDLDGISPEEAFAILGDEARLEIVRVLWEAGAAHQYEDVSDRAETLPFSTLRRRVDIDDNGRFNYHLSKLVPHFVRQEEDGYRLSGAGRKIARTVVAVSGTETMDLARELDRNCPLCGGSLTATYEDQWLRVECTECDGLFGDESPDGMVYFANYPAAGLTERTPEEALSTGLFRCMLDQAYLIHGVCRECAGSVSTSVSVCRDHRDQGCAECGTSFPVWAEKQCGTCGFAKRLPVELFVMGLTPVIGFLDRRGVDVLAPSFDDIVTLLGDHFETTLSEKPFRVSVTVTGEGDELTVSLDEELDVVALDRP